MKKTLVTLCLVLAGCDSPFHARYQLVSDANAQNHAVWRIDTTTGAVWLCEVGISAAISCHPASPRLPY